MASDCAANWAARPCCAGTRGDGSRTGLFFALHMIQPLGIAHGRPRRKHADPGTVSLLSKEDGNLEAAGQHGEASDVVLVLVGDENCIELARVFSGNGHTLQKFTAGEPCVHQNTSP